MRRLVARLGWESLSPHLPSPPSAVAATARSGASRAATTATPAPAAAPASASAAAARSAADSAPGWSPMALVMFVPSAVCGCLAYWQYERMRWKDALISARSRIAESDPVDLLSLPPGAPDPADYDKVSVRGRMLHEHSLYVGPRPRSVPGVGILPGYIVVTPMVRADRKGVVLVNRGWVPTEWKEAAQAAGEAKRREREQQAAAASAPAPSAPATAAPAAASTAAPPARSGWWGWGRSSPATAASSGSAPPQQPAAPAAAAAPPRPEAEEVVGVIQPDEQPNKFMPANRPDADEFHFVQRAAMAEALGLPPDTPLLMALSSDPAASVPVHQRSPLDNARAADPGAASASASAAYPAPKHAADLLRFTTMPADHLNYGLVWASLCLALAAMARHAVTRPLRGPRIVEHAADAGGGARGAWKASQAS